MSKNPLTTVAQAYVAVRGSHGVREPRTLTVTETEEEIPQQLKKKKKALPELGGPSSAQGPANLENDSPTKLGSHRVEGGADNEINSDDDDYEEPDFADGDLDEVSKEINVADYMYVHEPSPNPYQPTPQPELEGIIYIGGPPPGEGDDSSSTRPGLPRELAFKNQGTTLTADTLIKLVEQFKPEGKVVIPLPHMLS
ncbi:hypothetical protein POM88_009710 [Heracleum sosnowskyi]|uniref:Uncharacterized protein n=1 Tax=Heracleum sosnowskyi TaxID=360622 RepID=A0AAD8J8U0_9APIA|nr:hypothetical protein POM88_009710 [Heracleum sosnowskyi]